uniref:G-protein coupled receptors family 3 profile domain-containing protein n=1 Tax=Eptatretus burgeri TaxID=7764 RepID=A0A8C4WTZ7_EPTBU
MEQHYVHLLAQSFHLRTSLEKFPNVLLENMKEKSPQAQILTLFSQQGGIVMGLSILPQLLMTITWIIFSDVQVHRNTDVYPEIVVVECKEKSQLWAICSLIYLAMLIQICLLLVMKIYNATASMELRFITYSMLVFILILFSFIPAYLTTRGKIIVVTEIFAILATVDTTLGCIFLPKIYYMVTNQQLPP